jgi:hypothetical protein
MPTATRAGIPASLPKISASWFVQPSSTLAKCTPAAPSANPGVTLTIPNTLRFRYQVTPAGLRQALFLTRLTQRLLIPGLAELTDPSPPPSSRLRAAARAYDAALEDLTRHAGLAP